MRQPQLMKASPDIWLKERTARLAMNRPDGTPNCGHEATSPRWPVWRAHSIDNSTEPPHSPPTPMPWSVRSTVRMNRAPDADRIVAGHEGDEERRDAHQHQGRDQRRFAPDPVAVMAEDGGADGARDEADEIDAEGVERRGQRLLVREEELAEHQAGHGAVEEEIVPLDGRADGGGDDGAAQLARVLLGRKRRDGAGDGGHGGSFPRFFCDAREKPNPSHRRIKGLHEAGRMHNSAASAQTGSIRVGPWQARH